MGRVSSAMNFFFCIPLLPKSKCRGLGTGQQSIQSDPAFAQQSDEQVFPGVARGAGYARARSRPGARHRPPCAALGCRECDQRQAEGQKRWKRSLLLRAVRERGGGYVMMLDADDLVSNRLVGLCPEGSGSKRLLGRDRLCL